MAEQVSRDYEDLDLEDYDTWEKEVDQELGIADIVELANRASREQFDKIADRLFSKKEKADNPKWISKNAKTDMVNSPPHYTQHPSGIECIQVTEHMSFNVGNAVKYLWRCDLKGNPLEDLKKARFYVEREIKRREIA